MAPHVLVDRRHQRLWRERVSGNQVLQPLFSSLKRRVEFSEYMREGSACSRRAVLRLRMDQVPTAVTMLRRARPRIPRAQRLCPNCSLGEQEDTEHLLMRCPLYSAERVRMFAAVRETMSSEVLGWAGAPGSFPKRWVALVLDGELDGVPYAEAFGRERRVVQCFCAFRTHRRAYLEVLRRRASLRAAVREHLVSIVTRRSKQSGYLKV